MLQVLLNMARQKQTQANIGYLLFALPTGIAYYVFVLISLSCMLLSIFVFGIPLAISCLIGCWYIAAFERSLTMRWLHVDIPPMAEPFRPGSTYMQRLQIHLSRAVTWKSLLYLLLKFPIGLIVSEITLLLLFLMVLLTIFFFIIYFFLSPFFYLFYALTRSNVGTREMKRFILVALTGNGLTLLPLSIINLMAAAHGQFARLMLGMNDKSLRLADATARAELERSRAEQAEKSRRELVINVSHELRTPVASIRGHVESLLAAYDEQSGAPSAETLRDYLRIVHRETLSLGELVDDLLSVARAEAHELRVRITAVAVGDVVEEVYRTLMPLAKRERQILLIREIASGLPAVKADRQRLVQVLLNLVRNAITYTPDGGIVSIKLQHADNGHVELTVTDTGIGISSDDRARIFERFYRTDNSRSRSSGGFGLGLAIVHDFVIAMGGSVSVESTVGVGSCFHVLLQIA